MNRQSTAFVAPNKTLIWYIPQTFWQSASATAKRSNNLRFTPAGHPSPILLSGDDNAEGHSPEEENHKTSTEDKALCVFCRRRSDFRAAVALA
jgi:hypothetical protein